MKSCYLILVSLSLLLPRAQAQLFSDNFTRGTDPGPLTPWITNSGVWTVTGGVMQSGTNTTFGYSDAYIGNNFTNCTVQAQFKFQVGAYGGGLGTRVSTNNGAHYAAWIYPENSSGGSNLLRLIKFQTWSTFSYLGNAFTPMAVANLPLVGTNFHTLRVDLQTNQISIYYDGVQMINMADADPTYLTNGAVSLDMWTDAAGYIFTADNVLVNGFSLLATADSYNAVSGLQLSVAAPGILANDTGGNGALNASLVSTTTHGILNLSSNGGFTYTATNNYTGTDAFTYRANDGLTNASATVTITVGANHAPVANNDAYSVQVNSTLSVPTPGVLANDSDVDGNSLTVTIVNNATNGTVTLTNNGGFLYVPNNGYVGLDSFTYRANDGLTNSTTATVVITVQPQALFSDDFTRGSDPGPITPWIAQSGNWSVTGGAMNCGTNTLATYSFAYITNSFTNYYVQARLQFPSNSFGGGIGGRMDPVFGSHYAAWIYPENSPGGPPGGSAVLKLFKFNNFGDFSYNSTNGIPVAQTNLTSVGTNFHTVKLAFLANKIGIYFDGVLTLAVTDIEATPYLTGGIILDQWTDSTGYVMRVDDVLVNPLVLNDAYTLTGGSLSVPSPGVLANDTEVMGTNLTATLISGPAHGTLTLTNTGGFTYTPTNAFSGADTFVYRANDGASNAGTATVTISILNNAPVLPNQTNRTINEVTLLTVNNAATDTDVPAQTISYQLVSPPTGAVISGSGVITWTPTEAQGPGTYTLTTIATDNGSPAMSATNSFQVVVNEVNTSPVLPAQVNRTVNELALLTVVNTGSDTDSPPNTLTYTLLVAPTNAAVSGTGVITWTPNEGQGPGVYTFTTRVVDNGTNPSALSDTNTFTVTVNEVNSAPSFTLTPANRTIAAQTPLTVTNSATDTDVPTNTLTYTLPIAPAGASISASGVITWTPSVGQDQSSNLFQTVVTDNGSPVLSATNIFSIIVNSNPIVTLDSSALVLEGCTPTNNAVDPGETVTMTFAFKNTGTGPTTNLVVTLLATNGVTFPSGPASYGAVPASGLGFSQPFTFTAGGTCGGSITATLRWQDGATILGTTNLVFNMGQTITAFTQNFDTVTAPALPASWTTAATGAQANWRTTNSIVDSSPNAAFCANANNTGNSELVSPAFVVPAGPSVLSFRHRYDLEASTTTATLGFDGGVLEIKVGTNNFVDITNTGATFVTGGYTRVISPSFNSSISNRPAWSGTITSFTNTVINLPVSLAGQTVQLKWRCATDNGGPTGAGWRVDSIGITALVCCQNTAPVLATLSDLTVSELSPVTVINTATDSSTDPSGLTYNLLSPPTGAAIDTNGVITWIPTELQGPGAYTITTTVTDNGTPPLSATNSFSITVTESNTAPVLPAQANRTIAGLTSLSVTNTAQDSDVPTNTLTYILASGPVGATIDTNGIISWNTSPSDVPSTNTFTTVVTDNNPQAVNAQQLSATNTFTVTVTGIHNGPSLSSLPNLTVNELVPLSVTNTATDSDLPALTLTYQLENAPLGATIDTNGIISWTPSENQGPSVATIKTIVTDNGSPALSATNSFTVTVNEVNVAPVLPVQTNRTIIGLTSIVVTNTATDSDSPANTLTYVLTAGPTNAIIDTNGIISWTTSASDVPSTNTFTTVVTDNNPSAINAQQLSATNTFTVTVSAIHNGPSLSAQPNRTIDELSALAVTNAATDTDLPAPILTYQLVNPPTGATIDTNGVIRWTPSEDQGPAVSTITTIVTDNGSPAFSATNSFTVTVNEINVAPVLPVQTNRTIIGLTSIVVTNTATDSDNPANTLTYVLTSGPTNAVIDTNGIITWSTSASDVPSTNTFTTVVTDNSPSAVNAQQLSATNSFTVTVAAVHNGPSLSAQPNRTINELTALAVTNTATDNDLPVLALTYQLVNSPTNATIDSSGVIHWTPSEEQGPSVATITTIVTDNGSPALSATNSFTVTVNEVNTAPSLTVPADQTISAGSTLNVSASATDSDLPANVLTFSLVTPPAGMTISTNTGAISWTPTSGQYSSTNTITVAVNDNGSPSLGATNTFKVVVGALVIIPPPVIQQITYAPGFATITWTTASNRVYRLQFTGDLNTTNWTSVVPDITATSTNTTATNATGAATERFYRVQLLAP